MQNDKQFAEPVFGRDQIGRTNSDNCNKKEKTLGKGGNSHCQV